MPVDRGRKGVRAMEGLFWALYGTDSMYILDVQDVRGTTLSVPYGAAVYGCCTGSHAFVDPRARSICAPASLSERADTWYYIQHDRHSPKSLEAVHCWDPKSACFFEYRTVDQSGAMVLYILQTFGTSAPARPRFVTRPPFRPPSDACAQQCPAQRCSLDGVVFPGL